MDIAEKIIEQKRVLEKLINVQADYKIILNESAKLDKYLNQAMNIKKTELAM